jgi:hypothetical protein
MENYLSNVETKQVEPFAQVGQAPVQPAGGLPGTGDTHVSTANGRPLLQMENIVETGRDRHVFAHDEPTHETVYSGVTPECVLRGLDVQQANEARTGGNAGPTLGAQPNRR